MSKFIGLATLTVLILFAAVGQSQNPVTDADSTASGQPKSLLATDGPLRRLGESDFRLPTRDSVARMFQFSPDGKLLAACNGMDVKIWTFPDGKVVHDLSDQVNSDCIGFNFDGSEFLVLEWRAKDERVITHFDVNSGRPIWSSTLDHVRPDGATNHTFLDRGNLLSAGNGSKLPIWDTTNGRLLLLKPSVSRDAHPVASNGILTYWSTYVVGRIDLFTGDQITRFNNYMKRTDPICTPDGSLMAGYSTADKAIVFWKPDTNELVAGKIPVADRQWLSSQATLSSDGKKLVCWMGTGNWINYKMIVFDVGTGNVITEFAPPDGHYAAELVISPDGKWVFPSADRCVFTPMSTETGKPFHEVPDHIQAVETLSFTPDGSTLIVASSDQCRAWDVATGMPGRVLEENFSTPYVATVDNRQVLLSGMRSGRMRLQEIASKEVMRSFDLGESMHLSKFQMGADRKTFVVQAGPTFSRWDIATGDNLAQWSIPEQLRESETGHYDRYSFGGFYGGFVLGGKRVYRIDEIRRPKKLPDKSLDWGEYDLLLEDWTTQRVTNRLPIPHADHFHVAEVFDDQTLAVVTSDDWGHRVSNRLEPGSTYLLVWDVATGWERFRVQLPRPDYFAAFSLPALTPDVRIIATCRNRTQIEIWNGFTGELIQRFDAPIDLTTLTFSDDGATLASGHIDGRVYLWNTKPAWQSAIPVVALSENELHECWDHLAGDTAAKAMQRLLGDPRRAVEMLGRELQPAKDVPDIVDLIHAENAEDEIQELGPQAIDSLYDALEQSKSAETTARINRLIHVATSPVAPQSRRRLLAVNIVEQIGTAEARQLLQKLAAGDANAAETQAAAAALDRLGRAPL